MGDLVAGSPAARNHVVGPVVGSPVADSLAAVLVAGSPAAGSHVVEIPAADPALDSVGA